MRASLLSGLLCCGLAACSGGGAPAPPPVPLPPGDGPGLPGGTGGPGGTSPCPITGAPESSPTAPTFELSFPFPHASYDRETIGLSGSVTHADLAGVAVTACVGNAGVETTPSSDGRVVLTGLPVTGSAQEFTLEIEARHEDGSATRESLTLSREPVLSLVPALVLDASRNRIVGVDTGSGAVFGMPLPGTTPTGPGYRRELIAAAPLSLPVEPALLNPIALAYASGPDIYYVLDGELDRVVGVDPDTGAMTIVSESGTGSGDAFLRPTGIAFDAARGRLIVADAGRRTLFGVDPVSGDRTIVSSQDTGLGPLIQFTAIGLDAARDRIVAVSGSTNEIFVIDLASGDRSLLSDASSEPPETPRSFSGIEVDSPGGVAWLTDDFSNAVVRLNLFSGDRQSISSSGLVTASPLIQHPVIGAGPRLEAPSDAVLDPRANRLFVTDFEFAQPLIEIDQTTGDRNLLGDSSLGSGVNFRSLAGIELDAAGSRVFVADGTADVIAAIDLASGDRTLIDGPADGRGSIATEPIALAVDTGVGTAYVVDFTTDSLYSLDLSTGSKAPVSDATHGQGPPFGAPMDIELDRAGGAAYIIDVALAQLLRVDLATGDRTSLGDSARGMAFDSTNGGLFVTNRSGNEILRIDPATSARTLVSGGGAGEGQSFGNVVDLALDESKQRLIVINESRRAIVSVDIATGQREIISGDASLVILNGSDLVTLPRAVGGGPPLAAPRRIVVDGARQVAYVTDDAYDAVFAIDLGSGYRQIIAK